MLPYIFRTQVGQTPQLLIKRHNYEKGIFLNLLATGEAMRDLQGPLAIIRNTKEHPLVNLLKVSIDLVMYGR